MTKDTRTAASPPYRMGGPQWLALLAGIVVTGATVAILAGDAIWSGKWGQDQWLGLVILAATICFGLLRKRAAAERKWASTIAFAAMFGLGTILLVYSSMGRQESARADRAQDARNANAAIASLKAERKRVDTDIARLNSELARYAGVRSLTEVQAALDSVVGKGEGKVPAHIWSRTRSCATDETTRPVSAAACKPVFDLRIENGKALEKVRLAEQLAEKEGERKAIIAKLETSGGEQVVVAKAKTFAELVSLLGFDTASVEHIVSRIDILAITLFLEWSAIAALEYAFAPLMTVRRQTTPARPIPARNDNPPPAPPQGPRRRIVRKEEARADVLQFRQPVPQAELAERWGVVKSMVSMWMEEWEAEGIVVRTRDGSRKMVQAVGLRAVA